MTALFYLCAPGSAIAHMTTSDSDAADAACVCGAHIKLDWRRFRTKPRTRKKCPRCVKRLLFDVNHRRAGTEAAGERASGSATLVSAAPFREDSRR